MIRKAELEPEDPAVILFLGFLERDARAHPENLKPVTPGFVERLRGLTNDVEVRHEERIEGAVAL